MGANEKRIPRRIWILWFQGVSEAPYLVRKSLDSWVRKKPTWDAVVLDSGTLSSYIDLDMPEKILRNLSPALQSDLIRAALLSKYGGVWADATTFCVQPLDEWIADYASSFFFAFHKPGIDRKMSSWLMAAEQDSPLCTKLFKKLRSHLIRLNFKKPNRFQRRAVRKLAKRFNQNDQTTRH